MLSHIFLAFFERIHGKIYMRKIKQKKGVNVDESNRFEQLSLFELCMGDDKSSGGSETSEGKKQSIIYHFEGEESRAVEQSGISTLSGDQFTLRTGVEGTGNNVSSIAGIELDGEIAEEGTAFESSQRNNMAVGSDSKSSTNQVLERVHLEDERLSTRTKIQYNIEALKTVRQLQKENRTATLPEKEKLARFSGWGGCPHVFNESDTDYTLERKEIKELLTVHEYAKAKESTLTSFYTPLSVIDNIYRILERMGFNHGKIIETSMGNGNFFGRMPNDMYADSTLCGVELDSMSATISRYLYDKVEVENTGFESNSYPNNYFDLAISNVPFGFFQVYDMQERDLNEHHWNIHNYFFAKALKKVRDGGIVAFITSTDTMDGKSDILSYINEKVDFLGALRLPSNLFHENGANTDVACDIVFLKRNDEKEVNRDALFTQRRYVTEHRQMNDYFVIHPDHVFGRVTEEKGQFDNYVLKVTTDKDKSLQNYFNAVINDFPEGIYEEEQISEDHQMFIPMDVQHSKLAVNAFFVENDKLYFKEADYYYAVGITNKPDEDIASFKSETDRLKAICLIKLADTANELIRMQVNDVDEILYLGKRAELNAIYDDFVKQYGPIHKRTNIHLLDNDPRLAMLDSLENYDAKSKRASKSQIFSERTIQPKREIKAVESLEDAVRVSLDTYAYLNLEYMSSLLSVTEESVQKELLDKKIAFIQPESGKLLMADEYLSGDIYEKIEIAERYGFDNNIEALKSVLPEPLSAEDIHVQLGAQWVPIDYIREFSSHIFKESGYDYSRMRIDYDEYSAKYYTTQPNRWNINSEVTLNWGVQKSDNVDFWKSQPDYNGYDLFTDIINSRMPEIRNYWQEEDDDGKIHRKSEVNPERTAQARQLAEDLEQEFEDWIYQDYERKKDLVDIYNHRFNNIRNRVYDGSFISFPEMAPSYNLEPYQKNAIARIMDTNTNTLLWQQVGAGKTFEMVASGMEMKRLGLRNKILYVVPNHIVSQWANDFLRLYPNANVLVATKKDMSKQRRMAFTTKIATGNYDAIIMAHSSFKMISIGTDLQIELMRKQMDEMNAAIEQMDNSYNENQTKIVKQLERTKKSIEMQIQRLADSRRDENVVPFENLGIDFMFVDEAHEFKNLFSYTAMRNIAGVPQQNSAKAMDMYMKCKIIEDNGGGICFATGTPVTNTMAELYTMQRYLQENDLRKQNIRCFDAWAKTFGKVTNSFEISVDGSGFVNRSRFCKFFNMEELMNHFRQVAEIQTAGMLRKSLEESVLGRVKAVPPKHIGGKPTVIAIEPSDVLENYISEIVERTENIHNGNVDPHIDNMLKITSDSKKASIDMRLIDPNYPDEENGKLWTIAKQVYQIYKDYDNDKATQLIFCDSSTPHKNEKENDEETGYVFSNVYDDLKIKFVELGIPENEIAFIHDYDTELKKQNLFEKMNRGEMRVLIGSTPKLGAGTNIQERMIAIHHVDVPWRASDIEQQNGRAFRQGNMYNEIYEFRYVTKKSFDAYSWQMVETKSSYVTQLLEGTGDTREFEEDTQNSFSYAEVKAIASGNPIIKEKFEVDNEVKRLETMRRSWQKKKLQAQDDVALLPDRIETEKKYRTILAEECEYFKDEIEANNLRDTEHFTFYDVKGNEYHDLKEAWDAIQECTKGYKLSDYKENKFVGRFMKADVLIGLGFAGEGIVIKLKTPLRTINVDSVNPVGRVNFNRMYKRINDIRYSLNKTIETIQNYEGNLKIAKEMVNKPFELQNELTSARNRQKEINKILDTSGNENSKVVVEDDLEEERNESCMEL